MKARSIFLLRYYIFWLLFFQLARICFLLYHNNQARALPFSDVLGSLLHGMRMDASLAAYFILPVILFVIASIWVEWFRMPTIYLLYTGGLMVILLLVVIADLELYAQWGFRIDDTPLRFFSSPNEVWASISHLPLWLIIPGYIVLCIGTVLLLRRFFKIDLPFRAASRKILTTFVLICILPLLIIPIRGGFQLSPMNQSSVYFSDNNFANIAAINAGWNFMHGIMSGTKSQKNPYNYFTEAEANAIVDSLYLSQKDTVRFLHTNQPNIILIIWESFTEKALRYKGYGEVVPNFKKLLGEGLYFSNAYASGDRTDKGLAAILSGYPALNKTAIIRTPSKVSKLPFLSKSLHSKGYSSAFYYGGETEFANIKSYLFSSGFQKIVDKNSFDEKDQNSKWGAHDGVVAELIKNGLSSLHKPFFLTWLTLTSHEPYEVPGDVRGVKGNDPASRFFNSIWYTDQVVGDLINYCKSQPWYQNTLVVIVGDHGHILPKPASRSEDFRIPMLWLGGALAKKGVVGYPVNQLDIGTTLTNELDAGPFSPFSRDLFSSASKPWTFFTYNNAFGFVDPTSVYMLDNAGNTVIEKKGSSLRQAERAGKALQQFIYQDYLLK